MSFQCCDYVLNAIRLWLFSSKGMSCSTVGNLIALISPVCQYYSHAIQEKLFTCDVGSYDWRQECLRVNGRPDADKRPLPPTSIARARMKRWSLVPGGPCLSESMVELRTGCSVHQLFYESKKNKMVDETLIDWGFRATDFGSDL